MFRILFCMLLMISHIVCKIPGIHVSPPIKIGLVTSSSRIEQVFYKFDCSPTAVALYSQAKNLYTDGGSSW